MTQEIKGKSILMGILFAIVIATGVFNKAYLISAMYIVSVVLLAIMLKNESTYDLFYGILMVSLFYDYTIYVPKVQSVYLFHIVLFMFTLYTLYKVLFGQKDIFSKINKPVIILLSIWFVYMCITLAWALNKKMAVKYILIYIMMFSFISCMMAYNINKKRVNNTINILLFLISLVIIVGVCEVLLGQQLPVRHYFDEMNLTELHIKLIQARAIAFSYNTNNLAATLAILSPICLFSIYRFENIILKIWFVIVTSAGFSLIVITTSRTGYVAMLFSLGIFVIYSLCRIKTIGVQAIIIPVVLCLSFTFLYYNSNKFENVKSPDGEKITVNGLDEKMKEMEEVEYQSGAAGSLNERWTIVVDVLNGTIKDKNYLGYGVGNIEQFLMNKDNTNGIYSAHCYPIEILSDFGIPGVILYGIYYLYLLVYNIILGIKKKSLMCFAVATSLFSFMPASFGPSSITYVFSYWILMGLAVSCIQVYKNDQNNSIGRYSKYQVKEYRLI